MVFYTCTSVLNDDCGFLGRCAVKKVDSSSKKAGKNFLAHVISLSLNACERLLTVAILVRLWGDAVFGDWLLLVAAAGIIPLADLGMEATFGNAYQAACAQGEVLRFQRLQKVAMTCRVAVAGLAGLACLVAITLGSIRVLLGLSKLGDQEAVTVFALVALDMLLSFPRASLVQIYRAKGVYARGELLFALTLVGRIGVVGSAAAFGSSPTALATWLILSNIILGWGVMVMDLQRFPDVTLGLAMPGRTELAQIVATSKWFALSSGTIHLSLYFPVLVVGALVGGGATVVGFTVVRTLVNLARQIPTYLALSYGIELAQLYYRRSTQSLTALFSVTGRMCCGVSGIFTGLILGFGQAMLMLWTGDPSFYNRGLLIIFVLPLLLTAPALPATMLLHLGNRARQDGIGSGLQLLLVLSLVPACTAAWGVQGAAIGLGLAESLAIGVYKLRVGADTAGVRLAEYLGRCLPILGISCALSWAAAVVIGDAIDTRGWVGLMVAVGIWGVFVPGPVLIATLPAAARQRVFFRLFRLLTCLREKF